MIYEYSMQAPVVFGAGAAGKVGIKLKDMGCARALCICDAGVKKAGILNTITSNLNDAGIEAVIFDSVLPDPPNSMIDEVGALVRKCGADCVVGIGGGSSMDTAKAAAMLYKNPGSINNYLNFNGPPAFWKGGLPVVLLPTTAGTGSEATPIFVVSHTESNTKIVVLTDVTLAIVDPELCRSAPAVVTANGGLDAMAHAAEAVTAKGWNPYSELLGLAAIKRIARHLPVACRNGNDMEARSELSLAANWAGSAFALANLHAGHAVADSISFIYHTPHGLNCAWALPAAMEFCADTVPDKVKQVGEAMGITFSGKESSTATGRMTADAIRALMRKCGIPTLKAAGLDRNKVLGGTDSILSNGLIHNCPTQINGESATRLLAMVYDGYSE